MLVASQFMRRKNQGITAGTGQLRCRTGERQDRSVQGEFRSETIQIRIGKCKSGEDRLGR